MTGAQAGRAIIRRRIKKSELNGDRLIFFMVFSPSYLLLSILSRLWGKVNRANPVFLMQKLPIRRSLAPPSICLLDERVGRDYFWNKDFGGETMAQRRAEKPKKVKISPKQQEFYSRFKSSKPGKY